MSENRSRQMIPFSGGFFSDVIQRIKLVVRLMSDRRVSPWLKLIPIGSLAYFLFPDLMPGPVDDAAIVWLSTVLFVELCPPEVVKEHQDAINGVTPARQQNIVLPPQPPAEEDVVEGEIVEGQFKETE